MKTKEVKLVAIAVLVLIALLLVIMNARPVEKMSNGIWLFGHLTGVPLSLLVIFCLGIGFIAGFIVAWRRSKKAASQ
jgi:uncharacterized integral membrane protein